MLTLGFVYMSMIGLVPSPPPHPQQQKEVVMTAKEKWSELFEWSKNKNLSVMIAFDGQQLLGLVVSVGEDYVELRNQQYGSMVILFEHITAVAGK